MGKTPVILTCTQPDADKLCEMLKLNGMNSVVMPAMCVESIQSEIPKRFFDGMLITSKHAVINGLPNLPVIAVGQETADVVRSIGLTVVSHGVGGVESLDLGDYKSLLYPCALEPRFVPKNAVQWPIYKTVYNPDFKIPEVSCLICVFSVKAAKLIAPNIKKYHQVLCLSDNIADEFTNIQLQKLVVAQYPRYDAMINEIQIIIGERT